MTPVHAPGAYTGGANVVAVGILLVEFGMLRQAMVRDQVRLYAAQSTLLAALAVLVGAARHLPTLYLLAALTVAFKVVVIPVVLRRLLRPAEAADAAGLTGTAADGAGVAGSGGLGLAVTVLIAIVVAAFGFFAVGTLRVAGGAAPVTALSVSVAVVLVAFMLMIHRRDVASQAIGFFSLENGISLAALVVAAGMPLIIEVILLFDLLVAVVVFAMLMRLHHSRAESLSTVELTRLRG